MASSAVARRQLQFPGNSRPGTAHALRRHYLAAVIQSLSRSQLRHVHLQRADASDATALAQHVPAIVLSVALALHGLVEDAAGAVAAAACGTALPVGSVQLGALLYSLRSGSQIPHAAGLFSALLLRLQGAANTTARLP